jgi:5-methylcytosine-specific restriction endonuclease McrA
MGIQFKFDKKALIRAIDKDVNVAVEQIARDRNRDFDRLVGQYAGRPIDEIKAAIRTMVRRWDGSNVSESQIAAWAQLTHDGARIVLKPEKVKL